MIKHLKPKRQVFLPCAVIFDKEGSLEQVIVSGNFMWSAAMLTRTKKAKSEGLNAEKTTLRITESMLRNLFERVQFKH